MRSHFPQAVIFFFLTAMQVNYKIFGNVTSKLKRVAYANIYLAKLKENGNINIQVDYITMVFCCRTIVLTVF